MIDAQRAQPPVGRVVADDRDRQIDVAALVVKVQHRLDDGAAGGARDRAGHDPRRARREPAWRSRDERVQRDVAAHRARERIVDRRRARERGRDRRPIARDQRPRYASVALAAAGGGAPPVACAHPATAASTRKVRGRHRFSIIPVLIFLPGQHNSKQPSMTNRIR